MAPSATDRNGSGGSSNLANGGNSDTTLWEVVDVPGRGKGVIVTQDIAPGTLLLSEAPLITTDVVKSEKTAEQDLERALERLSIGEQDSVHALHNNFPGNPNKLSSILRSNGYPAGEVGGLFTDIARINHSCLPNSVQHWNELLGKQTVYAVRPIAKGEEVTTNYMERVGTSAERKEFLQEMFKFNCTCELCSLSADELEASDDRIMRAEKLDDALLDSKKVHFEPEEVMKSGRSLFKIYEQDGIKDGRLSRLYYDLFQICNIHSDLARARCFAKYYSDTKKVAEGPESINVLEMKPFVKNPQTHESFGSTEKWKTRTSDVPKGLKPAAFAKWLWREDI